MPITPPLRKGKKAVVIGYILLLAALALFFSPIPVEYFNPQFAHRYLYASGGFIGITVMLYLPFFCALLAFLSGIIGFENGGNKIAAVVLIILSLVVALGTGALLYIGSHIGNIGAF